ncbi:uncharacterized protein [Amphiura filiformis]|uniref:uncharacterized protein n=1 Tax=Amphiura filiformis TaxID=82378 RepID=UPI003B2183B3
MGSAVTPIVVNLCVGSFEQQALQSYPGVKPRLWLRFVDDTFVIIERTELEGFFQHINKLDDNIKFTQEWCKDDTLAFSCLISLKNDGSLTSKVYRKPTHTDHLQFSTNEAQNSAVYLHLKDTGHNIDSEDAVILDKEEQWHRRASRKPSGRE